MKTQNLSKLIMWICVAVIVVVLGLFLFVGYDTPSEEIADKNDPQFTSLLIYTTYAFIGILGVLTLVNFAMAIFKNKDTGLIRVFVACAAALALYFIFRLIFGGQVAPEGAEYTGDDMAVADAYIYTIGILFVVTILILAANFVMGIVKGLGGKK